MPYKIAIIDDERMIAQMYQFKLERSGYEIACAYNGVEGLELVRTFRPDLLLLDLMMPDMNGAELLERLRGITWGSSLRVVILTNVSKDEAPSSLRLLRVDRYVVKAHHTPAQVVKVVDEILGPAATA